MGVPGQPIDPRVKRVIRRVEAELSDPFLTVKRLARDVRLSPSRIRHLMICHVGQPPKQYIVTKRLLHAERLLTSSFLSVKEVMWAVGVVDPTHFSREFKKMFGLSPREYRKQHINALRLSA